MIWLFGDSIFRGAAMGGQFPDMYTAAQAEAQPLWPARSPAAVMNAVAGRDVARLGGITGIPNMTDHAARAIAQRGLSDTDTVVMLDVGPHGSDPDKHEQRWRQLCSAVTDNSAARLIVCGGFDNLTGDDQIDYQYDRPFGDRTTNDAIQSAAIKAGPRTTFLPLAEALRDYNARLGRKLDMRAYRRDDVHLNIWGQMRLCALILRVMPEIPVDPSPMVALADRSWRAAFAPNRLAAKGAVKMAFRTAAVDQMYCPPVDVAPAALPGR